MEKVPPLPNLALEALEIVSAWKQKFCICNQKELKPATTNPDCTPFIRKVEKTHCHLLQYHFLLFREKVKSDAPLGSSLPTMPKLLTLGKYLKSNKVW